MKRFISTAALFATVLSVSGCFSLSLDPDSRRNRAARVDTRTAFGDRSEDRGNDRPDDRGEDDADDAATGDAPPPPSTDPQPAPPANAVPPPPTGEIPYAIKAPGKPGFVTSPFAEGKLIDVRGLPPGTEFECPYTKRPIQVP